MHKITGYVINIKGIKIHDRLKLKVALENVGEETWEYTNAFKYENSNNLFSTSIEDGKRVWMGDARSKLPRISYHEAMEILKAGILGDIYD